MRLLGFLLTAITLTAPSLERRIVKIINASPDVDQAFLGIEVMDLDTGKILFDKNTNHLLAPASNTKLFTTALALTRLGADYRYTTRVLADAIPDADGCLHGDLVLKGAGDPSLSGRAIPYDKDARRGESLRGIEDLADLVAAHGIRRIDGDIVGDDTAYVWEPYPPGWAEDDTVWDYGAPVSALTVNDNLIRMELHPGDLEGDPAQIVLDPRLEYYWIDNRLTTSASETKVAIAHAPGSRQLQLSGTISHKTVEWLAIDDPARFAAYALADALTRRGIMIDGKPVSRHRMEADAPPSVDEPVLIASRTSPPLSQLLQVTNKVSENLYAELFLREAGHGSRKDGLDAMKGFLSLISIRPNDYNFEDGSGLSRLTLVTPHAITQLLAWMWKSQNRDVWVSLLPIGGYDGSLADRFGGVTAARGIHAKTGSLSHVNALSGYVFRAGRHPLAFSIIVNNTTAPATAIRGFIDKIALELTD